MQAIEASQFTKVYTLDGARSALRAVDGVDFTVREGGRHGP